MISHAKCPVCKPSCFEGVNPNARRYVRTKRTLLYRCSLTTQNRSTRIKEPQVDDACIKFIVTRFAVWTSVAVSHRTSILMKKSETTNIHSWHHELQCSFLDHAVVNDYLLLLGCSRLDQHDAVN